MEDYCSTHPETVEELLNWPWKRFEAFYTAHMKRRAVADLEQRKLALISGIWSNEGFNDDKGTREEALDNLEQQFKKAERLIFLGVKEQKRQADMHRFTKEDEENPFLRPAIEATRKLDTPRDDEGSVKQVVKDDGYEIDQD